MGQAGREGAVQMSARLRALADMVTPGSRVADVGCDHGFVPVYLVQKEISPGAIASDVRRGPLSRAEAHVAEHGLGAYIETRLSDGLANIRAGEADTLICAGMGGRLMQRILKQGEATARSFRELVLQPQSELEEFRKFLRRENYQITCEDILREDGKFYFLMKAIPVETAVEAPEDVPLYLADKYGGLLLRERHPVLRGYLDFSYDAYRQVAERIGARPENSARTRRRLEEIRGEMEDIERAVKFYGAQERRDGK